MRLCFREKSREKIKLLPYQQPTQVDRSRRPRRSEELCLRNSAIQLGVTLGDAVPCALHKEIRNSNLEARNNFQNFKYKFLKRFGF